MCCCPSASITTTTQKTSENWKRLSSKLADELVRLGWPSNAVCLAIFYARCHRQPSMRNSSIHNLLCRPSTHAPIDKGRTMTTQATDTTPTKWECRTHGFGCIDRGCIRGRPFSTRVRILSGEAPTPYCSFDTAWDSEIESLTSLIKLHQNERPSAPCGQVGAATQPPALATSPTLKKF